MIICSNCGAVNTNTDSPYCKKCGAKLPKFSRSNHESHFHVSEQQSYSNNVDKQEQTQLNSRIPFDSLQEIPISDEILTQIPSTDDSPFYEVKEFEMLQDDLENENDDEAEILKEIPPQPFRGSIIASKEIFTPKVKSKPLKNKETASQPDSASAQKPKSNAKSNNLYQKQFQLENDIKKELKFLSRKITVKELPKQNVNEVPIKSKIVKSKEKSRAPESLSEILKNVIRLDPNIEASAIIKSDGTILESILSENISDSLASTIVQHLSIMGNDIIKALNAGQLYSISIKGSNGILDIAPIIDLKNIYLLIYSNPKVKSGIIQIALNLIKKQVKEYFGIIK